MGYDSDWRADELNALMEDYDNDEDGEMDMDEAFGFLDEFVGNTLDESGDEEEEGGEDEEE